jgi:hypothetical protein
VCWENGNISFCGSARSHKAESAFNLTLSAQFARETGASPTRHAESAHISTAVSTAEQTHNMRRYCARHAPSETDCASASSINVNAGPVLIFQAPRENFKITLTHSPAATRLSPRPKAQSYLMWERCERAACRDLPTLKMASVWREEVAQDTWLHKWFIKVCNLFVPLGLVSMPPPLLLTHTEWYKPEIHMTKAVLYQLRNTRGLVLSKFCWIYWSQIEFFCLCL